MNDILAFDYSCLFQPTYVVVPIFIGITFRLTFHLSFSTFFPFRQLLHTYSSKSTSFLKQSTFTSPAYVRIRWQFCYFKNVYSFVHCMLSQQQNTKRFKILIHDNTTQGKMVLAPLSLLLQVGMGRHSTSAYVVTMTSLTKD